MQPNHPEAHPQRTCLLVDDEADVAWVLTHHLNQRGFATTVVGTTEAARHHLDVQPWDLVIVDVLLPGGDGRDLLPDLHRLDPEPVVIMTSILTRYDLDLSQTNSFLSKPFRGPDIDAALAGAGIGSTA